MSGLLRLLNPEPSTPEASSSAPPPSSQIYQLDPTQALPSSGASVANHGNQGATEYDMDEDIHDDEEPDDADLEEHFSDAEEGENEDDEEVEEGDGEGDGDEEDDEEEEEEEESDEDDDKSEDLEGGREDDFEITAANVASVAGAPGEVIVKSEPGEPLAVGTGAAGGEAAPAVAVVKKKRPRAASFDDMPKPRKPIPTIRLEFTLDTTKEYPMINIMDLAKEEGLIPDDAVEEAHYDDREDAMDVDGPTAGPSTPGVGVFGAFGIGHPEESAEEIARRFEEKYDKVPAKKKKKKIVDVYDTRDTFIDDSELLVDQPTHYGRTKKEGFFVHQGPLELVWEDAPKAKTKAAPRKSRNAVDAPPPRPSLARLVQARNGNRELRRGSGGVGTSSSPILIDADGDPLPSFDPAPESPEPDLFAEPMPIDRALYKSAPRDEKHLPPFRIFPRPVRARLMELKAASDGHNWNPAAKAKFPDKLKPLLMAVGRAAYEHDMFGCKEGSEDLFAALPACLPYNAFTLRKLIVKTCYTNYQSFLEQCEEFGLDALKAAVSAEEPKWNQRNLEAEEVFHEQLATWKEQNPNAADIAPTPEDAETVNAADPALDTRPEKPKDRHPWSSEMKEIFGQLCENNLEMCEFSKKAHNDLDIKSVDILKESVIRPRLYKKVIEQFPNGACTTDYCSKEMSRQKARKNPKEKTEKTGPGEAGATAEAA